jgi:tripartite-type tricarboxylate transporter receptor subunit TctC
MAISLVLYACIGPAAAAENYPTKPVRIIVPFSPGGTADILARMVAQKLTERLGQSFLIDNRPGANGNIGTHAVANSPADGYTLLMGYAGSLAINPNLYAKVPFDPIKDFQPITNVAATTQAIVARKDYPANNIPELIALAKAGGKQITFASAGVGAPSHMAGELFNSMAGTKLVHVPYKGSGAVLHDLVGGHVDVSFGGLAAAMSFVQDGQLKLLGVTSSKRSPGAPDTPTIAETLPGYEVLSWFGLLAPAGTPKPIVDLLNEEVVKICRQPAFMEKLATDGADVIADTPEHFHAYIAAEIQKWRAVISESGVKVE